MSNFSSGGLPQNALFIRTPDLWLNFTKTPTKIDHNENFLEVLVQFLKVQSSGENSKKEILKLGNFCRSYCALCVLSLILRPKMDPLAKTAPCWPNPKKNQDSSITPWVGYFPQVWSKNSILSGPVWVRSASLTVLDPMSS